MECGCFADVIAPSGVAFVHAFFDGLYAFGGGLIEWFPGFAGLVGIGDGVEVLVPEAGLVGLLEYGFSGLELLVLKLLDSVGGLLAVFPCILECFAALLDK